MTTYRTLEKFVSMRTVRSRTGLYVWTLILISLCNYIGVETAVLNFKEHSPQFYLTKTLLSNYSKQDPPQLDKPTKVMLSVYINSFYAISEQNMDYAVNLYLRQSWHDPRLAFKSPDGSLTQMRMQDDFWQNLWVPDVFFRNEKNARYHEVTVPNRLLRINNTGHVWYTLKITATLSCPMNLRNYPLDSQTCPMMFESFGYTMDTMYFAWMNPPFDSDKTGELPQFKLGETISIDCSQNYTAGAFTCLALDFVLHRNIGFFIIQVYVPSILIVILSWVSFWINIDASPARVSLGLLTVLTTTTMSGTARESLPRVPYMKAIDIWMIVCLTFVFASLIEYAVVNVLARHQITIKRRTAPPQRAVGASTVKSPGTWHVFNQRNLANRTAKAEPEVRQRNVVENSVTPVPRDQDSEVIKKKYARTVDKISRKAFPIAFLAFNIIYWITYTVVLKNVQQNSSRK